MDLSAGRLDPAEDDLLDLGERYVAFHRGRGNDPQIGLRLPHLARAAGLVVTEYRGWFEILDVPRGLRPPSWAAREAMVAAGVATEDDVRRWGAAFDRLDAAEERPRSFLPFFAALAQRPTA